MAPRKKSTSTKLQYTPCALPEEILREILAYDLVLSPEDFAGAPFSARRYGQLTLLETMSGTTSSTSTRYIRTPPVNLLLVSKQWLRIATPLLYEAAVLPTPVHTAAFAAALRLTALGTHVRRLHVLDGYGRDFLEIAQRVPRLHTLALHMDIRASVNVKGLVAALPLLRPTALGTAIPQWTSLTRVILNSGLSPWLTDALCRAPSLQYVSLDEHYLAYDQADHSQSLYGRGWSGNLARISRNPAFRAVLCRAKDPTLKQGKYQVPQYPVVLLDERTIGESFSTIVPEREAS